MDTNDDDKYRRNAVALFRYGVRDSRVAALPVADETIRGWLKARRRSGFDALLPKPRSDRGQARALPREVADLLCTLKDEQPALSVRMVIDAARASGEVPTDMDLAPATVHRLLSRAELMERRPDEPASNDRRRRSRRPRDHLRRHRCACSLHCHSTNRQPKNPV